MAKLALALHSNAADTDRSIPIDRRTMRAVVGVLGETVLLYRFFRGSFVMFYAVGKVGGVEIGSDGKSLFCRLRDLQRFGVPPVRKEEAVVPGAQRTLSLSPERFDAIIAEGQGAPDAGEAMDEALAADFQPLRSTAPMLVYRQVLEGWGYRCAVTGRQFFAGEVPHAELRLAYLRPKAQGGPLHVRNLVPMIAAAEAAWTAGTISATADHRIIGVIPDIGLSLFDQIERVARLHLPEDARYGPDPDHLAFHRTQIFGR